MRFVMSKKARLAGGVCILFVAAVAIAVMSATTGDVNAADEKVVTTASGLKYVETKIGDGAEAKVGSKVMVHYTGKLENGKKFDSSLDRKEPFEVTIGKTRVIKGWTEGLQGMKAGGKRKLIIPPELGYGADGTPDGTIPKNATLIFEIEMLEVK
jgi:peptidylprolyl isomerase